MIVYAIIKVITNVDTMSFSINPVGDYYKDPGEAEDAAALMNKNKSSTKCYVVITLFNHSR